MDNGHISMTKIGLRFDGAHIEAVGDAVRIRLSQFDGVVRKDERIAIAVGSRGIQNLRQVVKSTVDWVKDRGAQPFIIPAMGSHGGATPQGQKEVLASYGITEEAMGVPVLSSMQVVELEQGELPNKVYMDKLALEADGTMIINRIKPHTDFHSRFESGLIKMCVIGLGKHAQALAIHRHRVDGLKNLILPTARQIIRHGNLRLGIGLVENAYDQTAEIAVLLPEAFEREEPALLEQARSMMPRLPVDMLDVLLIDEMGKDISGVGLDTNIIGRIGIRSETDAASPRITNIVVCDLTEASHGNALGMGLADIVTRRLADKVDFNATYANVETSTFLERGKLPVVAPTARQATQLALRTCGPVGAERARVIRIKNTLHLSEMYVSDAVLAELRGKPGVSVLSDARPMFTEQGALVDF